MSVRAMVQVTLRAAELLADGDETDRQAAWQRAVEELGYEVQSAPEAEAAGEMNKLVGEAAAELRMAMVGARAQKRDGLVADLLRLKKGEPGWGEMVWKPLGLPRSRCDCGEHMWWHRTRAGFDMPVDDKGVSHFANCPHAKNHRRPR